MSADSEPSLLAVTGEPNWGMIRPPRPALWPSSPYAEGLATLRDALRSAYLRQTASTLLCCSAQPLMASVSREPCVAGARGDDSRVVVA